MKSKCNFDFKFKNPPRVLSCIFGFEGGESGRGEALSGSFLGREGPQKSTPYPGFKLEFKKNTPQIQKFNLKCKSGDFELKLKFH